MTSKIAAALGVSAFVIGASATPAAPQTAQPGQMTQARVWIENRGDSEAIPIDLRAVSVTAPLRVQVVNADAAHASVPPVQVRLTRPVWDYATIYVAGTDDVARALNARGAEGWEVAAITAATGAGTTFLLKRSR